MRFSCLVKVIISHAFLSCKLRKIINFHTVPVWLCTSYVMCTYCRIFFYIFSINLPLLCVFVVCSLNLIIWSMHNELSSDVWSRFLQRTVWCNQMGTVWKLTFLRGFKFWTNKVILILKTPTCRIGVKQKFLFGQILSKRVVHK